MLSTSLLFSQGSPSGGGGNNKAFMKAMSDIKGSVYGKVIDLKTKKPVEYASVAVLWYNKDSILNGALTKENGEFKVDKLPAMGGFRLRVSQIGYKTLITKFYLKIPDNIDLDIGNLSLETDEKVLKEVEVVTEKSTVGLSIDKRTYNVDKDLSVRGGTAVDVMKNVPGVTVDADGNVQLRNLAPNIYIDGRPTTLTLQQIPADQIDRVEIITNPSVKYDANATGGILNIIMKKNLKPGYNGMAMAYVGTGDRYGGMFNLNVKEGKWNVSAMYSYNQSINITKGYSNRTTYTDSVSKNPANFLKQNNITNSRFIFNFGRLGIDYSINNRNTISLNTNIVGGAFRTFDDQVYSMMTAAQTVTNSGNRNNYQFAQFQNYSEQLQYKKTFPKQGKELTADLNYNFTNSNNGYVFSTYNYDNMGNEFTLFQSNGGISNAHQYVFQSDFVNPLGDVRKFEAGVKSYYKNSLTVNTTSDAIGSTSTYTVDPYMSNNYVIHDMVNAAYANYNDKIFYGIHYQAGLRFEQSYYKGEILDKNQSFSYNYPSNESNLLKAFFPGIYFSKKAGTNEFQVNFSRKIQRPNFFQLMPVVMFADRQNYRIGNPSLKPEFRNNAELNYNKIFGKGSYLGSAYFSYIEQPITDVAYPQPNNANVLVNTTINGSNSIRYGTEHTIKYTFFKNLDITLNANGFYTYINGYISPQYPNVTREGFAYNAKAIFAYRFPKQITLQLNGSYASPLVLLIGQTQPVYGMDLSLNYMIGTKWVINGSLIDVFNSRNMGTVYDTPYYYQDLLRRREARYVKLSVTYLFGKMDASIFKRAKQMKNSGDQNQGNQDGLDFK